VQIIVPILSRTKFFPEEEYFFPKPLIDVGGQTLIQRNIAWLKDCFGDAEFIFIVEKDENVRFSLENMLKLIVGENISVVERSGETAGAICSCLLAIDHIDPQQELMICNSDLVISGGFERYFNQLKSKNADAGVFTFNSIHPQWSYVSSMDDQTVTQAFEKKVVSNKAIAGLYYFKTGDLFVKSAMSAIINQPQTENEFYLTAAINYAILQGSRVVYVDIPENLVNLLFSPAEIAKFSTNVEAQDKPTLGNANILIPAAGLGSRFSLAGWKKPKPFIDLNGQPMFSHVVQNVSLPDARTTILLRNDHSALLENKTSVSETDSLTFVTIPELTEGTAITVLSQHQNINNCDPLLVANSDQIVDFDVEHYVNDCLDRGLDGSILVFRELSRDPKWSYAKLGTDGLVTEVAEKKPISDLATVGIYLFSRGKDFVSSCIDMVVANERVNGEFYTCPVYNYMIAAGMKIGVYEIQREQMHGLGTPDDLQAYINLMGFEKSADQP